MPAFEVLAFDSWRCCEYKHSKRGKESKEEESFLPKGTLEVSMGEDQGISMNLLGEESSTWTREQPKN